jgi:hypothetical protein
MQQPTAAVEPDAFPIAFIFSPPVKAGPATCFNPTGDFGEAVLDISSHLIKRPATGSVWAAPACAGLASWIAI